MRLKVQVATAVLVVIVSIYFAWFFAPGDPFFRVEPPPGEPFDLIITGGTVIDGTGKPAFVLTLGCEATPSQRLGF